MSSIEVRKSPQSPGVQLVSSRVAEVLCPGGATGIVVNGLGKGIRTLQEHAANASADSDSERVVAGMAVVRDGVQTGASETQNSHAGIDV